MNRYQKWGFTDNPFTTLPLQPNETGKRLLIGRDEELKRLISRITTPPRIPTVEGGIGTGKTSLVNIATFDLTSKFLKGEIDDLYVACRVQFQIADRAGLESFEDKFYYEVAQTLIQLGDQGYGFDVAGKAKAKIDAWMNSPQLKQVQFGISLSGFGGSLGGGNSQNTTAGFDKSGFRRAVTEWLREAFPTGKGGVVCLIDNMELLEASSEARTVAEQLRDSLFSLQGVRWVLCGANGIIQGVVASPRLDGRISSPIEVTQIPDASIPAVFDSRVAAFCAFPGSAYLPITEAAFHVLYSALNRNLRNLLSTADEFCGWIEDQSSDPATEKDKDDAFFRWFEAETKGVFDAVASQVKPRAWEVFDGIVNMGGATSPGEYENFGFRSMPVMRPHVLDLEEAGLLQSTRDDKDQRRKSITVTSKGFKCFYHRQRTRLVRSVQPADPTN